VMCSEGLSNRVCNIIRRYIDRFVYICFILYFMYLYCYAYVFLLLCMFCSVYSVFIVPTGTLRLPCLRFSMLFPQL